MAPIYNTHAEGQFHSSSKAKTCCIFSEHFYKNTSGRLLLKIIRTDYVDCFHLFPEEVVSKLTKIRKQRPRGVLRKKCFENMQQIYRRTPIPMCLFEIMLRYWRSPVNLLHIFRTPFTKNTFWVAASKSSRPEVFCK